MTEEGYNFLELGRPNSDIIHPYQGWSRIQTYMIQVIPHKSVGNPTR